VIVVISTSGGFGGFGLGPDTTVSLDALDPALRTVAREMLSHDALTTMVERASAEEAMADGITYTLRIAEPGGEKRRYVIPEGAMTDSYADLLDQLREIGEQK